MLPIVTALVGLIVLDLLAIRFGARGPHENRHWTWW